ncbi:MAG TPA: FAD/NAD(P)-binding protein [Bryobacteraceae bacterium]|nr:FAD/NAD(P)-binding protein [Bryobacteraceae bacterium]
MSPSDTNCSIAIVGGGCSGLLVAVNLLRKGFQGRVTVIEPRTRLGPGLAYSTSFIQHLLNVPAGKMSALPERPAHFLEWLRANHWPDAKPDSLAPRRLYGQYLQEVLEQTLRASGGSYLSHIRAEVTDAAVDRGGARLALSDGMTVHAKKVVLALGNPASCPTPSLLRRGLEDRWHLSPWLGDALRVRFPGERILLFGTGLTAVDAVLALHSQEMPCQVYMLSRRGILPKIHNLRVPVGQPPVLRNRGNLRMLVQEVRGQIEAARQADLCWRAIVDGLRPISNEVWGELTVEDQQRFVRHLKKYWKPHRHRMAPEIRERLDGYRASGILQVIAGRLQECSRGHATQFRISLKNGGERTVDVDRIISCTGIQESYANSPRPLIRSLVENGLARPNHLGMGFQTDGQGALLDGERNPSSIFFTLGPPRRGELFESTAVPEIRAQAAALAQRLLLSAKPDMFSASLASAGL